MTEVWEIISTDHVLTMVRATLLVISGIILGKLLSTFLARMLGERLSVSQTRMTQRFTYYLVLGLFVTSALRELGFSLTALLGAAGILSIALGFAAQTSVSNFISGLFLMAEKPFSIGDLIEVGGITGEVLEIDLLSVKLRTFDNRYVRIPNETLLKSETITLTKFPIRRIDLKVGVAYKEDLKRIRDILFRVADKNPLCLEEPKPIFIFQGYGESALEMQFSVWTKRQNFLELRNGLYEEIKLTFDEQGIEIPFPHRTLYSGSVTEPFPVKLVGEANSDPESRPENR